MYQWFEQIQNELETSYQGVASGNMMRSPAITYRSKVFAFFHQDEMGFKLGEKAPEFIKMYPGSRYLNPFKNRPPMKGWLVVPAEYQKEWKVLAEAAYQNMAEKF